MTAHLDGDQVTDEERRLFAHYDSDERYDPVCARRPRSRAITTRDASARRVRTHQPSGRPRSFVPPATATAQMLEGNNKDVYGFWRIFPLGGDACRDRVRGGPSE